MTFYQPRYTNTEITAASCIVLLGSNAPLIDYCGLGWQRVDVKIVHDGSLASGGTVYLKCGSGLKEEEEEFYKLRPANKTDHLCQSWQYCHMFMNSDSL